MKPTRKSDNVNRSLDFLARNPKGREGAIEENECSMCPHTFEDPDEEFRGESSIQEYRQSGLCQKCQDEFFA